MYRLPYIYVYRLKLEKFENDLHVLRTKLNKVDI